LHEQTITTNIHEIFSTAFTLIFGSSRLITARKTGFTEYELARILSDDTYKGD
jgi:hypothetical protein